MVKVEARSRPSLVPGKTMTDWGRMQKTKVGYVTKPKTEADLQQIINYAADNQSKVSIRGSAHSAGGHSFVEDGIVIDMRDMNNILELDEADKTIRVQAGATWEVLTRAVEPLGLAITTKQEFDTFTVGGSVAANVHGKTIDFGPLIESILSFRLLKADGEIVNITREAHPELFSAVIGGYGLFGVIVDVTFQLVKDRPVEKTEVVFMNLEPLMASYVERVKRDPKNTPLCYGFLDSECRQGYYVTYNYVDDGREYSLDQLKRDEPNPLLFNIFVWLQRDSGFVRRRSFHLMRGSSDKPEVTLRSRRLLLWDHAPAAFQNVHLQKYFVPIDNFLSFVREAGAILKKYEDDLPVLTNHFRFVPGNGEALMSFSHRDTICLIPAYLAKKNNKKWLSKLEQATGELLNACLDKGGSYYLTFDIIASTQQFRRAYPQWEELVSLKKQHDPAGIFSNCFFEKYGQIFTDT